MKPKMRIKLLSEEGVVLQDRLVDQYTEFNAGPKELHKGPISLEVNLFESGDIERTIIYLNALVGKIPQKSKIKKSPVAQKENNPYKDIFTRIKKHEFIEDTIEYLDNLSFRFVHYQFLEEKRLFGKWPFPNFENLDPKLQYLTRLTRIAKDPMNDKYDFKFMVGIRFFDKRLDGIKVYYKGKQIAFLENLPWKTSNNQNLKVKKKPMVFPPFMSIEERKKWRYLHRKTKEGKELGPREVDFYNRYKLEVMNLNKR
jgi:hypothetical protein